MFGLKPLDRQVVVLIGASSGIGRAAALELARRGAKVVVSSRDELGLRSLVGEIRQNGGSAIYAVADVREFDQMAWVADYAYQAFGRIDTWVHAAAVSLYATFEETTPEEFRRVVEINFLGQMHGAKAALPYLRRTGRGALIHISSVEAIRTFPYQSAYGASKHGIAGFVEALRLELRHEGVPISVSNIMPGSINTPLFNQARTKLGVMPKGQPPFYSPWLVAKTIAYAAEHPVDDLFVGDAARFMALMQRISPRLMDQMLLSSAFQGQLTDRPKPRSAPDNLAGPLPGYYARVEGDFGSQTMPISIGDQLRNNPGLRTAVLGLLVGAGAMMAVDAMRDGGNQRQPGKEMEHHEYPQVERRYNARPQHRSQVPPEYRPYPETSLAPGAWSG